MATYAGLAESGEGPGGAAATGLRRSELLWGAAVAAAGILPRLLFVTLLPTMPVSDFRNLVDFAVVLRDTGMAKGAWHWQFFNPGMPTLLALVFQVFRGQPDTVARLATAVLTGLMPLLPFLILRGTFSLGLRTAAGLLLALWPGHIFFSGVVAQDNWVLIPAVALACLAAGPLAGTAPGRPVWSGLLLVLGAYIRQEMLVVLLPLSLAAAGVATLNRRLRNFSLLAATAVLLLCLVAGQRLAGTGTFGLTTGHAGLSVLGSYMPGAEATYWKEPQAYIASIDPTLLDDPARLNREAPGLVLREFMRRPGFHLLRMASGTLTCLGRPDVPNLWWSLRAPGALPPEYRARAEALAAAAEPLLTGSLLPVHAFFLASLFLGLARRHRLVIAISLALSLKVLIHAVTVAQPRYFLAVIALEIVAIAAGLQESLKEKRLRSFLKTAAVMSVLVVVLGLVSSTARSYVLSLGEGVSSRPSERPVRTPGE